MVEALDARLALPGHARPFTDVAAHIDGQPRARRRRASSAVRAALRERGPLTAYEVARGVYGERLDAGDGELAG